MKGLIEGAVGAVRFTRLGNSSTGQLVFGTMTLVGAAVLMNMVIAKINSSYKEVTRKGKLFYYKELFDLRYLYKLDSRYEFLMAMEHPCSLYLLPALCCLKCLERKRKKSQDLSQSLSNPAQFLLSERQRERIVREQKGAGVWRCCGCVKCKKVSPRKGVQAALRLQPLCSESSLLFEFGSVHSGLLREWFAAPSSQLLCPSLHFIESTLDLFLKLIAE